jgi:hypothetical protein
MKKVIELLDKARDMVIELADGENFEKIDELHNVLDSIKAELKAPPRWETPEQREKRTGKAWQDKWAVYVYVIDWPPMMTVWKHWKVMPYGKAKTYIPRKDFEVCIVCATEAGPPPDNWRPND